MVSRSFSCLIDLYLSPFILNDLFICLILLLILILMTEFISDQTNDVTLETGSQDEEEDEVDILEQIRLSHEAAAKEKQVRSENEEAESAPKRPRLETQPRSSTPTPSRQLVTAAQEPMDPVPQPQQQQGAINITMDQLESLVTRALAASSSQNSLHEAIHQQTSTLAQVVRSSGAVQEQNLATEPKIHDRSWWLTLESVDIEDNSQTKL